MIRERFCFSVNFARVKIQAERIFPLDDNSSWKKEKFYEEKTKECSKSDQCDEPE